MDDEAPGSNWWVSPSTIAAHHGAGTRRHRPVGAGRRVRHHRRTVRVREVDVDQRRRGAAYAATENLPTVVLGADAARRLGSAPKDLAANPPGLPRRRVVRRDRHPRAGAVAPDLGPAALIGYRIADELFDTTHSPSTLFVRTAPEHVEAVRDVLARSVDPESPDDVEVSQPSDGLEARAATDDALRNLLLGLGAVALVGGVGVTNVMVIPVLERRGEIGVRRLAGGAAAALGVDLIAGVSPAIRAARLDPPTPSARRDGVAHSYG
jgi:hypothetical protein